MSRYTYDFCEIEHSLCGPLSPHRSRVGKIDFVFFGKGVALLWKWSGEQEWELIAVSI